MAIELATAYVSIVPSTDKLESGIRTALNRAERNLKISPTVDTTRMHRGFADAGRQGSDSFLSAFKTYTQQGMSPIAAATGLTIGRSITGSINANRAMFHTAGTMIANTLKGALLGGIVGVGALVSTTLFQGFKRLEALDRSRAQLENLNKTFQKLGKGAIDVTQVMDEVKSVVEGTPVALNDAFAEVPKLLASGIKPGEELKKTLAAIADAAGFSGDRFSDLALGFEQVINQGKLTAEELNNQFRNLPIRSWLATYLGTDEASVSKMISDGKIGAQQLFAAIEQNAGGFAKAAGDTIEGAMANMQTAIARTGANLLAAVFGGDAVKASDNMVNALKQISAKFDQLSNWITAHRDDIHRWAVNAADALKSIGEVLGTIAGYLADHPGLVKAALTIWAGVEVITAISSIGKLVTGAKDLAAAMGLVKAVGIGGIAADIGAMGTASSAAAPGLWALYGPLAALAALDVVGLYALFKLWGNLPAQAMQEQQLHAQEFQNQMQQYMPFEPWPGMDQGAAPPANWPGLPQGTPWPHGGQQTPNSAPPGTPTMGTPQKTYPPGFIGPKPLSSRTSSGLTQYTASEEALIRQTFPGVTNIGGYRATDKYPDHPSGQALDVMVGGDTAYGNQILAWALSQPGVKYVLWQQKQWNPGGGFTTMADRGSPTENHMDHLHIMFNYDQGGWLPPGVTLTQNATGEQELILSPEALANPQELVSQLTAAGVDPAVISKAFAGGTQHGALQGAPPGAVTEHRAPGSTPGGTPEQAALTEPNRFEGLMPTGTGSVPVTGTSFIAKALNLPNEFVNSLIDTGASIAQTAISAAVTAGAGAGTFGAAAAAGPAAGAAAGFGIQVAASEAKRLTSYGFQMAAIGIDSVIENLFSPIGGAPRWMGYDYTAFVPSIATQALQMAVSTGEKGIESAITQGISGQQPGQQPGGPVQPEQLPGQQPTTPPVPPLGQTPAPGVHVGTGAPPGPAPAQPAAPEQQQNPIDWLSNLFGFDQGGWLQPGGVGVNMTRRPEPVLSAQQWDTLSNVSPADKKQWGVYVENIYASDAEDVSRQISAKQNLARMRYAGRP